MKKVLVIATYPIAKPEHGGQKRTHAIVQKYKTKFRTEFIAVFYAGFYSQYSRHDVPLGPKGEDLVKWSPLVGDIICGEAIFGDEHVRQKVKAKLLRFKPDIIHIEQPYAYLGLKKLLATIGLKPKIIFGSQNYEAPMKREILKSANYSEDKIKVIENKILKLEKELSKNCDLLVACTKADIEIHKQMGARNCVLAPNGINQLTSTQEHTDMWHKRFSDIGVDKIVLFVGSAHPPNWVGFLEVVGNGLGFMPYDTRVVVAGSISDYFDAVINPQTLDPGDATFWLRAYSAGRLSEPHLQALLLVADVIILPITEGGGSNLKTAEAITANKKVVATTHALRSFEWFKDFPNVWVADTKDAFQRAINDALKADFVPRTTAQSEQAKSVLWENCLDELIGKVSIL